MHGNQPHPATPISDATFIINRGKKRGDYRCGRCGGPKKGHKCPLGNKSDDATPVSTPAAVSTISTVGIGNLTVNSPISVVRSVPICRRRALSFDDVSLACEEQEEDIDQEVDLESSKLPAYCLWEVFRRLTPPELLRAAPVCRGWRDTTRRVWRAAEGLRIRVPMSAQIGLVGSVLQKCPELLKLSLRMESDVDATILACVSFSCRNLQSLEILTSDSSSNRINGDELSRFVADKRCLTSLKIEGCSNLGSFVFSSLSLSTLWLSDLHSVSKMVFNCPNLKEISLDFSRQENDCTDLAAAMDALGRCCPKLQNIHIASVQLSHSVVLALTDANLRGLRMLSLVLGSGITDASVAAIASSYSRLELLDLSGSSISDSGIGMICNVFAETLSKLLLALCPNITSSGIQFATAQLPCLELMDCGMTICDVDPNSDESIDNGECYETRRTPNKSHLIFQKLIIKHSRLKKLSLWGCSGLDGLYLNCPSLNDLNLNCCRNLHPERVLLQCPNLAKVHACDCKRILVQTIETQVSTDFSDVENNYPLKRLPDGSKRVRVPYFSPMPYNDEKKRRMAVKRHCAVIW